MEQDQFQTQNGTFYGTACRATDEAGNEVYIKVNAKKPNAYAPGAEFNFQPNGKFAGIYQLGKKEMQGGGAYPQNRPQNAPQASTGGQLSGQAPKPVPTMSQAVAVLGECIEAVKAIGGSDAHATTLFLARLRGDIRKDPTAADIEAQKAAEAAKAQAAKEAADRAAAEAARQAALAAMPPMEPAVADDIPF